MVKHVRKSQQRHLLKNGGSKLYVNIKKLDDAPRLAARYMLDIGEMIRIEIL